MPALSCENNEKFGKIAEVEDVRQLVCRSRSFQHPCGHIASQEQRDRVHHQADNELVDAKTDPQKRRDRSPQRSSKKRRGHAKRDVQRGRERNGVAENPGGERAHQHLPLGADVP